MASLWPGILSQPEFSDDSKNQQNVVAQPNINAKQYGNELKIPVPSLDLQNQFADSVKAIEAQKAQAQASLAQADHLFNSLLQKAFKGELVKYHNYEQTTI